MRRSQPAASSRWCWGWAVVAWALIAAVVYLVGLPLWSRVVENARAAVDRLMNGLVWAAVVLALVPLVSLLYEVIGQGAAQINGQFLTYSMRNVLGAGGGIYHGLVGTLLITLGATVISVPIGGVEDELPGGELRGRFKTLYLPPRPELWDRG